MRGYYIVERIKLLFLYTFFNKIINLKRLHKFNNFWMVIDLILNVTLHNKTLIMEVLDSYELYHRISNPYCFCYHNSNSNKTH